MLGGQLLILRRGLLRFVRGGTLLGRRGVRLLDLRDRHVRHRIDFVYDLHGRHFRVGRIWRVFSMNGWLLLCLGNGDMLGMRRWDLLVCGLCVLHHLVGRLLRGPR
jgi:hypothetical protein